MKKVILAILALLTLTSSFSLRAQNGENVVILWDVSGSLLPQKSGVKDLDGTALPTYQHGNGLWNDLKGAVIECIKYVEDDPESTITIHAFNDNIIATYTQPATEAGKAALEDLVTKHHYKAHSFTNIVEPVSKFYSLLDGNKINYMFLFTDGEHDQEATRPQFIPTLDSWTSKTQGRNAYGFYVLVHPAADNPEIRNSVTPQSPANFWIVQDAKVRIKICSFPASFKYNVRDEKGPKPISMRGKYAGADGKVQLIANDVYYDVFCSDTEIKNGKIDIEVKPKQGVTPPESHTVVLTPQLSDTGQYTFVGPKEINLVVSNLPERSLNLAVGDKNFGKASYYGDFLFVKEENNPVVADVKVNFSDQAKAENASATMKIYLVDGKKGKERVSPASQNLTIRINGEELKGDSFKLTPDMTNVNVSVCGGPQTKNGKYYGCIELVPNNLDNFTINGSTDVFKWKMGFAQKWNPLKKGVLFLGLFLLAAFLLWMIMLKPMVFPRFGSIQKTFNVPGMAPLIVKFKGAREVRIAASHKKKQSGWNRFWTGKIIYKTHPAFESEIVMRPSKGKRILTKVDGSTYRVSPNPMPGIGASTIMELKNNRRINVN